MSHFKILDYHQIITTIQLLKIGSYALIICHYITVVRWDINSADL